jgi:hypothetical protein
MTSAFDFDERERVVLEQACRQSDINARLDAMIAGDGLVVKGSTGQPRLSAAVGELRSGRLALTRLIRELALPDEDGVSMTARQRQAQHAANARWGRARRRMGDD